MAVAQSRPSRASSGPAATAEREPEERKAAERHDHDGERRGLTLNLPMLSIQVHPPRPHLPRVSRQELGHAVDIARSFLPPRERLAYYGGLGALAAFGVIEWPVAAAIGAGTIIAQRARGKNGADRPAGEEKETGRAEAGERPGRGQAAPARVKGRTAPSR